MNFVVVIFILMPLGAILGIFGYIFVPRFYRRIRGVGGDGFVSGYTHVLSDDS